jgi:hypothetical protein
MHLGLGSAWWSRRSPLSSLTIFGIIVTPVRLLSAQGLSDALGAALAPFRAIATRSESLEADEIGEHAARAPTMTVATKVRTAASSRCFAS